MTEVIQLTDLKKGQKAVISELAVFDDMRRRLQDIGLIEGTVVECVGRSPLGDPAAYYIRGAVIALRSEDSGRVLVYRMEPESQGAVAGNGYRSKKSEIVSAADTASICEGKVPLQETGQNKTEEALWD